MENAKISVIVPVYRVEKYLQRCIDSLLTQTYENLQIILVDDGSPDSCPQICDEYVKKDSRIVVVHKENGGLSSARNAGLAVADGKYVGFIDSDDYVSPDIYKKLIETIGDSDRAIANVMYVRVDENGKSTPSCVPHTHTENITPADFAKELMLHLGDVSVCSKLFPKKLFDHIKFDEGKLNEDLLFMLELLPHIDTIHFIGHIGYYYFVRIGSISSGYGKAVIDMVGNSLAAKDIVDQNFPDFCVVTARFALYQHMVYLLAIPESAAVKENQVYQNALRYIRKNTLKNLRNPYLKTRNKVVLTALMIAPKTTSKLYRKKKGK